MSFLARSLALATTLALLPGTALATTPTTTVLAALQTVAVADDAGVAQALAQPTTQVTVVVNNTAAAPVPAVVPPPIYTPAPYSDRIYKDRKSGRSLLIVGLTLGGMAYVYTSLAGAIAIDKARDMHDDPLTLENEARARADRRAFGKALLIPGIGPALAIPKADTALRAWGAGMAGLTQAVALTMTIVGIHRLGRANRLERLSFGAMATGQQAHASMTVRF
jgi:hypothetical protein